MKKATRQADGTVIVETMTADEEKDITDCATHGTAAIAAHEAAIAQKATESAMLAKPESTTKEMKNTQL